jgi:hypothetical protein
MKKPGMKKEAVPEESTFLATSNRPELSNNPFL